MAHRQALENRLSYIHRQMEQGTDYPAKEDGADGNHHGYDAGKESHPKRIIRLVKAQPHQPEFCRMQNSGLVYLQAAFFALHLAPGILE
ncbi:hypothetical protein F941_00412 [Acinetobacter bouvetii DSM 14964 = CIP 107468]|uniref:Uncharacterized protein n=2 Tax=Moraxellaceae TaxID=468 RepID=N9DU68_9GAMM|nr:hypothetical protein F941_00412 [Acinetobacter bouvetii DSM 14964 = CIP 107468]QXW25659.1 hypothetical protein KXJ74_15460 [Acinetobacter johnsonii]